MLFDYPRSAAFGRVLPKSKIYEHAKPGKAVKELFVRQIEQIVWSYKLAPQTVNIDATPSVPEIQVFSVALKDGELGHEVLRCIDQAISFPIFFELFFDGKVKPVAAFKRQNASDASKLVVSDYFEGKWYSGETIRSPLPVVFDLEVLYGRLLQPLLPFPARQGENLQAHVERMDLVRLVQRELQRCETNLGKEKQFNLKIALNAELRKTKEKLEGLIG